jgi:Zn-dependent protease with chaperone function
MDFFAQQDRARRITAWLVGLMVLSFVATIVVTYLVVVGLMVAGHQGDVAEAPPGMAGRFGWWQPDVLLLVAAGVSLVIGGGSLFKAMQLSGRGDKLAEMLGGRRLVPDSTDPLERKLLNVVEEMAIASGTAVPPVYLLDSENGINAFAAGLNVGNAVIGVTRGAATKLSRDELQGVVAHEFSHILHGDMRLNLRLIAIVHGILVLGLLGYYLLRIVTSGRRSRSDKDGGFVAVLALLGVALMVIGYLGTFLGSLIKAAVSRQREFLADASAVQFTRNPAGLAAALARIADAAGSRLQAPRAAEASHMFFASGLWTLFATHPPLAERIARLDASQLPDDRRGEPSTGPAPPMPTRAVAGFAEGVGGGSTGAVMRAVPVSPIEAVAAIGDPTIADVRHVHGLLEAVPVVLREAVHEPFGCRAVVYALLLDRDPVIRERQFEQLARHAEAATVTETRRLLPVVEGLPREQRLPLVDASIATLLDLSAPQYRGFRASVEALIEADDRLDLFEWVLQKIILRHLDPAFGSAPPQVTRRRPSRHDVAVLLSSLAHAGTASPDAAARAFATGAAAAGLEDLPLQPAATNWLETLGEAVDALNQIRPTSKRKLMEAVAATVSQDGLVAHPETELLRGIADTLGCPIPPLLGVGQAV